MTWDDHRRRNAALDAVLLFAKTYPDADLPLTEMPGLLALFGDRRGLVLALQHRWSQQLWVRIQAMSLMARTPTMKETALQSAQAWRDCATANPALRRLLDRHLPEFGDAAQERVESCA
jgi:hypothetical protein